LCQHEACDITRRGATTPLTRRRTPRPTIVLALLLAAALGLAVAAVAVALREAGEADAERRVIASRDLAAAAIAKADAAPELSMLLALEAYARVDDQSDGRSYDARNALVVTLERNARLKAVLRGFRGRADALAFSPNGRALAVAASEASSTGAVGLWDVRTGARIGEALRGQIVKDLAFAAGGRTLVALGYDPRVTGTELLWTLDAVDGTLRRTPLDVTPFIVYEKGRRSYDDPGLSELSDDGRLAVTQGPHGTFTVWDVTSRKAVLATGSSGAPVQWSASSDGRFLAARDYGDLTLWDLTSGNSVRAPSGSVTTAAFGPRGATLAVGTRRKIVLWDAAHGRQAHPPLSRERTRGLAFSSDGRLLASAHAGGRVVLWDLNRRQPRPRRVQGRGDVLGLAFSPSGRSLEVVRAGGVEYVDVDRRVPLVSPPPSVGWLSAFSPDGTTLATAGRDGVVRLWDLSHAVPLEGAVFQRPDPSDCCEGATPLAFSPDGGSFASGAKALKLWDVGSRSGRVLGSFDDGVLALAFSPDGRRLSSISGDRVQVWDRFGPVGSVSFPGGQGVAFTSDGRAVAASNGNVVFWDAETLEPLRIIRGAGEEFALSPDGRTLVAGTLLEPEVRLWDVDRRAAFGRRLSSGQGVWDMAFSPDGAAFAAAGTDGAARLWEISDATPFLRRALPGPAGALYRVEFTPDGSTLIAADSLWDVARALPVGDPLPASADILAAAASRDGLLITSHADGTIRSWDRVLLSRDLVAWRTRLCPVAGRSLSHSEWRRYVGDEPYRETCP
jgi:WD40 repeat protein